MEKKYRELEKILKYNFKKDSLLETLLVSINDELVDLFLSKKISFQDISKKLNYYLKINAFNKYKRQKPKNLGQIVKLNTFVRLKTKSLSIL